METLCGRNGTPLYMHAAVHFLRGYDFDNNADLERRMYILHDSVNELFRELIDRWMTEWYEEDLVKDVICLLCITRSGLMANEIDDLLHYREDKLGIQYGLSFGCFYDALSDFMSAGGGGFIRLFHKDIEEVVKEEFLDEDWDDNAEYLMKLHAWCAEYFMHCINDQQ